MTVEYQRRLEKHYDELKWLYCELYPNGQGRFEELCAAMEQWYKERNKKWKALDRKREKQKDWYKSQKMLGMMLYIDAFADNISGLEKKLDYLKECNVNYLHLCRSLQRRREKATAAMRLPITARYSRPLERWKIWLPSLKNAMTRA